MRRRALAIALTALAAAGAASAATPVLSAADKTAAFRAAGFKPSGREWVRCEDEAASAQTGFIEAADLNGDGAPEAWVRESSTFCYGNTAEAFVLVTKRPAGWSVLLDEVGMALERPTKRQGWPDIEVGGPGGGPFPVFRYDGAKYVRARSASR